MTPPDIKLEKQERMHRPIFYLMACTIVIFLIGGLMLVSSPLVPDRDVETADQAEDG